MHGVHHQHVGKAPGHIPDGGENVPHDEIFGDITVENAALDDQVLLKRDGLPTYNFANVVDDHLMLKCRSNRGPKITKRHSWSFNIKQLDLFAVILKIFDEKHRVITFFLRLDIEPISEAVQLLIDIVAMDAQIKISRIPLHIDLVVD